MSKRSRNLPHLYLRNQGKGEPERYKSPRPGRTPPPPFRNREEHAEKLERRIGEAIARAKQQLESRESDIAVGVRGFYLEFDMVADKANAFENLENKPQKIELVSVKPYPEQEGIVKATVFVPESAQNYFLEKVEQYREQENKLRDRWKLVIILTLPLLTYTRLSGLKLALLLLRGKPKHQSLITRIEDAEIATVHSLFTDDDRFFPDDNQETWWEVWLRQDRFDAFQDIAQKLNIPTKYRIDFPERTVVLAVANVASLQRAIDHSDTIAELRIAKDTPSFFLEMRLTEQWEWERDLVDRILPPRDDAVAVCLLDTGVTRTHDLISPGLDTIDLHTCEPQWGTDDHDMHGTLMAGLILYSDLQKALETPDFVTLTHRLESVKILPPIGQNEPKAYGDITKQAIAYPEIQNSKRKRIFCLAITSPEPSPNFGIPSSWSAAIDQLCFDEDNFRRLIIIAAGNIREEIVLPEDSKYLERNDVETIENPGQAWNALVVGAYTEKVDIIHPDFQGWKPVAPDGDLSPRSRTSVSWNWRWPIRPDIVCEGGNYAFDGQNPIQSIDDLSLLTTYYRPDRSLFERMTDTSCATALASHIAARILTEKPNYWPETIRALIVHSAEWTPKMLSYLTKKSKLKDKHSLLRRYGYGVPDLERALKSTNNDLTLIIEDHVQPFIKEGSDVKMRDMNFHSLPWPTKQLEDLGAVEVELKVTLSYFIKPNPGERGWGIKHRYASHGLRFEVKRPLETDKEFRKRINKAAREEDERRSTRTGDKNWFLGSQLRNRGSIHSDRWSGTAVDLSKGGMIAVYPVGGWWKEKPNLDLWEQRDQSVRYSLIITIRVLEAPEIECDIYTPVFNLIEQSIENPIEMNY